MRLTLKFRKQRLAEHGGAEAFQEVIQNIGAALFVVFAFQKILRQQNFINGGSNLGDHGRPCSRPA